MFILNIGNQASTYIHIIRLS